MLYSLFSRLLFAPMFLSGMGSPRYFWVSFLLPQAMMIPAAVAWLAAPWAIWKAFGTWWMLFWLVPTGFAVFAMASSSAGGG